MCLAMNADRLELASVAPDVEPQLRGRQGPADGRTSSARKMAAAAAIAGHFADVRELNF